MCVIDAGLVINFKTNSHPMSSQTIASLALFGGAFDPVHIAHLKVARAAVARMEMGRVILIPSAQSPLKTHAPLASDADRLAMLQLATAHEDALEVSAYELEQGGTSYSLKTALYFQRQYPRTALYWILKERISLPSCRAGMRLSNCCKWCAFWSADVRAMSYSHRYCWGCVIRFWSLRSGIVAQLKFANAVVGGSRLLS